MTADQIAEAIAVAVLLAQAVAVWLVVGVLAASLLLLAVAGTVTVGVRALWRGLTGGRSAPHGPDGVMEPRDAPEPSQPPSSDTDYQEAA